VKAPFKMCLVVSRPCGIAHKQHVQVAGIEKYPDDVPKAIDTLEKVLAFLTGARDGIRARTYSTWGNCPVRPADTAPAGLPASHPDPNGSIGPGEVTGEAGWKP